MSDTGRSPRPGGTQLRQRRGGGTAAVSSGRPRAGNSSGLWRFYTEDSTGLKIGPVPCSVMLPNGCPDRHIDRATSSVILEAVSDGCTTVAASCATPPETAVGRSDLKHPCK
ncbi:unnamed protein product [Angiostrongylus costaricensis]|uniref:Uncharacterized protein n=1 Tax=Angiostrongylus costaricensis TaxID=334426 RepID=A0A0R3PU02_ANGCS|nr:unnamed protein product [Angiostrongylus costaricensis]